MKLFRGFTDYIEMKQLFYLIIVILFFACTETGDYEVYGGKIPDQESWESHIIISRSGEKSADIYAEYLAKYSDSRNYYISDSMRVDFYENGQHSSFIVADSGVINERSENIIALGNVMISSDSGFVAYTDQLYW